MPAADPAVLYGGGGLFSLVHPHQPDWQLRRIAGNYLILRAGVPAVAVEGPAGRLTQLVDLPVAERGEALALLPAVLGGGLRRLRIRTWNGRPVLGSEVEEILRGVGFQRDPDALVLYRRFDPPGQLGRANRRE
ncbi:MAG: hypothetical protein ACP5G2_05950 [Candidatus Bipolaricaulaceae bacterium]